MTTFLTRLLWGKMNRTWLTLAVFCLALPLVACGGAGDADKNADKKIEAPKAKKTNPTDVSVEKKTEAIQKKKPAEDKETEIQVGPELLKKGTLSALVPYNPLNKVDPFATPSSEVASPENVGGSDEGILTRFEIRYFRLVGIIQNEEAPLAVFEDPRGRSYVVGIGTHIGQNNGTIDQILSDHVIVTEKRMGTTSGGEFVTEIVPVVIALHPAREQE